MDSAIITGASGEPALSIARRLCALGIRVYALAGNIPEIGLGSADEFVPVPCDPTAPAAVAAETEKILAREPHLVAVILAGQYLTEEFFEAVSTEEILAALNAQVAAPLCAVRLALPSLIANRGHVIVVSPGTGTPERRALNAAADAALNAFAETLFAETRDTGVKTCRILLQNNEGKPDPAARFTNSPQSRVHAEVVADAVETVFRLRENNALTQIVLRPQATRETPHIPVSAEPKIRSLQAVRLPPPQNFPPAETPIPTPEYRRPDYAPPRNKFAKKSKTPSDDGDGFADDYVDPELRYLLKIKPPAILENAPENAPAAAEPSENAGAPENSGADKNRNRRNKDKNARDKNRGNAHAEPNEIGVRPPPKKKKHKKKKHSAGTPEGSSPKTPENPPPKTQKDAKISPRAQENFAENPQAGVPAETPKNAGSESENGA